MRPTKRRPGRPGRTPSPSPSGMMGDRVQGIGVADICDGLDELGLDGVVFGPRGAWPGCPPIAGRVYPLRLEAEGSVSAVEGTLEAIQAARPGDVLVVAAGDADDVNCWGGICTRVALRRGLQGAVLGGATRDTTGIASLGFPVYAMGVVPQSVRGRRFFVSHGEPVVVGDVELSVGDFVFADPDGLAIVPRDRYGGVLDRAQRAVEKERRIVAEIEKGAYPVQAHREADYEAEKDARGRP